MLKKRVPTDTSQSPVYAGISTLAEEICEQQFSQADALSWQTFIPASGYKLQATQLLSSLENEALFAWGNDHSCLYLDFWNAINPDVRFLLFYCSPEYELSGYISSHPFDMSRVEQVLAAWITRTRAMLAFFMCNRDCSLLLNVQSAASAPDAFVQSLEHHFQIDFGCEPATADARPTRFALIEYLATTLLLKNKLVAELYDEVRSAATQIDAQDRSMAGIEERSKALINAFLAEVTASTQRLDAESRLEQELASSQLQINQMADELEYYFKNSIEQEKIANTLVEYLSDNPSLKIARQVRQAE